MPKDDLQELINTLSSAEKRYYTSAKGGEGYNVILFNTINSMQEYDKQLLKKKLNKNPELVKNLSKYKTDTYVDILRELRTYREDKYKSVDVRLKVWLTNADLLIERGLYKRAIDYTRKARQLAEKYDKYIVLLEIIEKERELIRSLNYKDRLEKRSKLVEEKSRILGIINDEHRYNDISSALYAEFRRMPATGESRQKKLDAIIDDEIVRDKTRVISFTSQYRYMQIKATHALLLGDREKAHQYYVKAIECWERHPHQRDEYTRVYVEQYFNYLNSLIRTGRHEEYERAMQIVKAKIMSKNIHEQVMIFQRLSYSELLYHLNRGNVERLLELLEETEQKLKRYEGKVTIPMNHSFQNMRAQILFFCHKYEEALREFQKITSNKDINRIDIKCAAWIFQLAIAYENGDEDDIDFFKNTCRSARRYFSKLKTEDNLNEVYNICTDRLHKLDKAALGDRRAMCIAFKEELEALNEIPEKRCIGLEEMIIWLKSIIIRKSMLDILKGRRNRESG